jgi:hypothetical protein
MERAGRGDGVDPELEGLGGDPSWGQPLMILLVAAFSVFLAWASWDDLRYSLSESTPLDIGPVESLHSAEGWWVDGALSLPSQRAVQLEGIPQRRSISGDRAFYKFVGAQVYMERHEPDERHRLLRGQPRRADGRTEVRELHVRPGRLVAFEDLPARYQAFMAYYAGNYMVPFCGYTPDAAFESLWLAQRDRAVVELADRLGRQPSPEEIAADPVASGQCVRAWLLISDELPGSFRWLQVLYGMLVLVWGGCVWLLWQWARRWMKESSFVDGRRG